MEETMINLKWVSKKTGFLSAILMGCLLSAGGATISARAEQTEQTRWEELLEQYQDVSDTDRLIFVKCQAESKAQLEMYKKVRKNGEYTWQKILSCGAFIGKSGIDKEKEGDMKTPTGTFWITSAFGIKNDPGTELSYTKVNKYLYWSEEEDTYNQLVDVRTLGREKMEGEHLIDYKPSYNYAMVIGYNPECVYGKGSAIFLHVKSRKLYTSGCVAVSQANMKRILKNATEKTRICIYEE